MLPQNDCIAAVSRSPLASNPISLGVPPPADLTVIAGPEYEPVSLLRDTAAAAPDYVSSTPTKDSPSNGFVTVRPNPNITILLYKLKLSLSLL